MCGEPFHFDGASLKATPAKLQEHSNADKTTRQLLKQHSSNSQIDVVEVKFPTASFAVLELQIEHWSELEDNCARLIHLIRPRDLDPALGPMRLRPYGSP